MCVGVHLEEVACRGVGDGALTWAGGWCSCSVTPSQEHGLDGETARALLDHMHTRFGSASSRGTSLTQGRGAAMETEAAARFLRGGGEDLAPPLSMQAYLGFLQQSAPRMDGLRPPMSAPDLGRQMALAEAVLGFPGAAAEVRYAGTRTPDDDDIVEVDPEASVVKGSWHSRHSQLHGRRSHAARGGGLHRRRTWPARSIPGD